MVFYILIASVVVFIFSLFPVTDFDIWWHLAGGKFMLEQWQFPYQDTFSYTAQGAFWYPNSWGFTALSYAVWRIIGLDGLNILKAFIPAAILLTASLWLWREKLLNLFSLSFITFSLFAIRSGFSLRPHTFAYLIFVIFLVLLFTYQKNRSTKLLLALAATQFVWTNFHASFIWGLALTGLFVFFELVKTTKLPVPAGWWSENRRTILLGVSVFGASLAHIFYGPAYLFRIVTEFISPSTRELPVRDLLPPTPETFLSLTGIVLLSGLVVLFFSIRQKRFDIAAVIIFFSIATIMAARFVRDLILYLALAFPMYVPTLQKNLTARWHFQIPHRLSTSLFLLFLFGIFLMAKNTSPGIGLGQEQNGYPVKAVEFIQSEQILEKSGGQLYNTYNFGGYLIWANQPHKVFIDGRVRPYLQGVFKAYWDNFAGDGTWRKSVGQYNITAALMTLPHTDGKKIYNQSTPMFPKEEWALIYSDDIAMLYVKRIDAYADLIEKYEYRVIDPQLLDVSYISQHIADQEDFEAVVDEIKRAIQVSPDSARLHFSLAYTYGLANLTTQMEQELKKALEINPRFEPARNVLNQLSEPRGEF